MLTHNIPKRLLPTAMSLCLIVLTGCASVSVNSVKDPTVTEKLNRIYVLVGHGGVDQAYSTMLASAIEEVFAPLGLQIKTALMDALVLDEKVYFTNAAAYKAQALLVIAATGGVKDPYGGYPTIHYDASLYNPNLQKRIWRAQINNSGGTAVMKKRMRMTAEKLLARMREDGVI